jgi:hypothetical protein
VPHPSSHITHQIEDLLAGYPAFRKYERNDISIVLEFRKCRDLTPELQDFIISLRKANASDPSAPAPDPERSKDEAEALTWDEDYRFLIFYPSLGEGEDMRGDPVGFAMFRFAMQEMAPVLFVDDVEVRRQSDSIRYFVL